MNSDERLNQYARRLSPDARKILGGAAEQDAVTVAALRRGGLLDDAGEPTSDGRAVLAIVRIHDVARLIAENDGLDRPPAQASRVYIHVVAPLVWLLAEARHRLVSERLAHAITTARLDEADQRLAAQPKTDCGDTGTHPGHGFAEPGESIAKLWCSGVLHQPPAVDVEAGRLRREVEFEAHALDMADRPPTGHRPVDSDRCQCGETMHTVRDWFDHWRLFLVCACPIPKEADALAATGRFEPIRCSVHPAGPGFCCAEPRPIRDAGEPNEHVIECGNCGADMDEDMLDRWRAQGSVA